MVWGRGWDNPFHPSGSVSADADLIVRLWKERRLDKWCGEEGGEDGHDEGGKEEKNDCVNVNSEHIGGDNEYKNNSNGVKSVNDNISIHKNKGEAVNMKTSCCSIM